MSSIAPSSGTWDEASSPAATRLARRFEDAWRGSNPRRRPEPGDFLPEGPEATPAAWLALLRIDLNLRWDEGEPVRVETYRDRYPKLDVETLVALCYEEFCRREEDGQAPFPSEYDERFPDLSDRLRRVFDIHELVGNAASTDFQASIPPEPDAPTFPEAGQTIAGFHLVEELGRGSFARVFLARERQLADRPVALKVARGGSREPQTLARLQHTHIVPVHSYRIDPVTGLHLLCMPYFGRVTLSQLLGEPSVASTPTGAGLLDGLDGLDPSEANGVGSSARTALAKLPYARAIAWWGARLAEALQHAHDRGILHRDIKPSNVLVTGDGLPMLLDFNLAGESWAARHGSAPENLGGTLAYMAPEHLEAVARGEDDGVDHRSDLYSLGVLLFEALTGTRPFAMPSGAASVPEALRRSVEDRRRPPPWLRGTNPEVPAALERVIRRCLEPDPKGRFPAASELASDLQAVAEDLPLRWTREPLNVRAVRRLRRSWRRLVLAVALGAGIATLATSTLREGGERVRIEREAAQLLGEARASLRGGEFAVAIVQCRQVAKLTRDRPHLRYLAIQAAGSQASARESLRFRAEADALEASALKLKARLIEPDARLDPLAAEAARALAPFRVFEDVAWSRSPALTFLDAPRKARLLRDADELLFGLASRLDPLDPRQARRGVELCDRALAADPESPPWRALRGRFDGSAQPLDHDPTGEASPRTCFEWATLFALDRNPAMARTWLDRSVTLDPADPWYHLALANCLVRQDAPTEALGQFEAAVALRPTDPTIRRSRARLFRSIGETTRAESDEARANSSP